jgi:nucleoside 2-deoxyribosyltransferase
MTKPSVFISHGQRDAALAERVGTALERLGLEAVDPARALRAGQSRRATIQSAIKRADAMIMLISSPQSLSSSWMSYEAGVAEALGKHVMLLLPNKYPVTELPAEFASTQIVELDPQAPERAAHEVASRLALA